MAIAVSACLLGENCKYDGGSNYCEKLAEFVKNKEVILICPEVMGGLSVPREPAEIADGRVVTRGGTDVDEAFRRGAQAALEVVLENDVELVVLQSRSPSCGVGSIYDGSFSGRLVPGDGVFAKLLKANGVPVLDVAEL